MALQPLYIESDRIAMFNDWTAVQGIRIVVNEAGLTELRLTTDMAGEEAEGSRPSE